MRHVSMAGATAAALGVAVVLSAYGAPQAHAADLPAYMPPPPAPVWSWTGPYAGLHVGTVDGDIDGDAELTLQGDLAGQEQQSADPNGILGGVQAGYNFQFNSIVLGVEGDFSLGDVDDVIYPEAFGEFSSRVEAELDWMATIRGRLGWAWDRTLFYATGGVAFTELEITSVGDDGDGDSDKNSYFGWTVGGGVEHAVSDHITLKAEYLYADFGREDFEFDFVAPGGAGSMTVTNDAELKTHTFRVGVNWLF